MLLIDSHINYYHTQELNHYHLRLAKRLTTSVSRYPALVLIMNITIVVITRNQICMASLDPGSCFLRY